MLQNMFRIVPVDNSPVPPFIKTVPTLFNESNNTIISGSDLFNLIKSYTEQAPDNVSEPEPELQQSSGDVDEDGLSPWSMGEMGRNISSCYSFIDNENPIQNNFELIGDVPVSGGIGDLSRPTMSSGGEENKSDKRQMFDNDYEDFIKNRNTGIPNSTNRA